MGFIDHLNNQVGSTVHDSHKHVTHLVNGVSLFFLFFPESTYRHQATIDDEVVTMEILDTAGQVGASATLHRKQQRLCREMFIL
jgi:hypothetical protein